MRYKFPTEEEKLIKRSKWRRIFAWRPVKTRDNTWVWFELVYTRERRPKFSMYYTREYDTKENVVLDLLQKD